MYGGERLSRSHFITMRTARSRYPVFADFLRALTTSHSEVVVREAGPLPRAVARSTARTSGKVEVGFRLVNDDTLVEVPMGRKVREVARPLNPSHVVQIETTDAARRGQGRRPVRAATVTIYRIE